VTLPPEAFACLPLDRAAMPLTVWHIAVAALIGNAWGPQLEERTRDCIYTSSGRWRGPMGRPPPKPAPVDDDPRVRELAARVFAPGPVPYFVTVDDVTYDMRGEP
jgi:hypothetical protein